MTRPRDSQKQKLYNAESFLHTTSGRMETVPEIEAFADRVISHEWFKRRWPSVHYIEVKDGRGARVARGFRYWNGGGIKMPKWSRNRAIVLHEIAHIITPNTYASHGPEYARNFLDLVRHYLGKESAEQLRASYKRHRVKYRRIKSNGTHRV